MVKLNHTRKIICIREMNCGQIGEIVESPHSHHIGRIVQRYKDSLISIGMEAGNSWYSVGSITKNAIKVRLLEVGETIEIVKN